jgi:RHS repeat-associated protein
VGKVTAVKMDVVTKKSGHTAAGMAPSVCLTPAAPSPLPIPYPVVGSVSEGIDDPCMRTKICGAIVMTVGSTMSKCHGNEPGTLKEVVSLNTAGPCFPALGAPIVISELGMMGITGSIGQMNKQPIPGVGGSASGAGGGAGGSGGGGPGGGGPDGGSPDGPGQGGGGGGGSADGAAAPNAPAGEGAEGQADAPAPGESSGPADANSCQDGHPVDVVSGCVVDQAVDLEFGNLVPFVFKRLYSSKRRNDRQAQLGPGWAHSLEQSISDHGDALVLRDGEGRLVSFEKVQPGQSTFHRRERLWLHVEERGYRIESLPRQQSDHFARVDSDGPARLSRTEDRYGNALSFTYDDGRLQHVIDPSGRRVEVSWIRHGDAWRIDTLTVVARGRTVQIVRYQYDRAGCLQAAFDSCHERDEYEYDSKRRMVAATIKNGTKFEYAYDDETNRCIKTGGPKQLYHLPLEYDLEQRRTVTGGEEPRIYDWNDLGLMTREATPGGIVLKERAFDDDGYLIAEVDGAGNGMHYWYDEMGELTRAVDAKDQVTAFEYAYGRPVKRTTPDGQVAEYSYDPAGSLTGVRQANGASYTIHRDERGRVVAVDGPSGRLAAYEYDSAHNLLAEIDERGQRITYGYDAMGRPKSRTDALGRVTRVEYDAMGRRTAVIRPDGSRHRVRRDSMGKVVERTDPMGNTWNYRYAGMGVLSHIIEPDGKTWRLDYTSFERLAKVRNPNGEEYSFAYDEAGRIVSENSFDDRERGYSYDAAGLLSRVDFNDGTHRELYYDQSHRVSHAKVSDGSQVVYRRDAVGRLIEAHAQSADGKQNRVVFERDAYGRVVGEQQDGHWLRFAYDTMNRRTGLSLPDGSTTAYGYGVAKDLLALEHNGHRLDFKRDAVGRAERVIASTGPAEQRQARFTLMQQHDQRDRVIEQRVYAAAAGEAPQAAAVMRRFEYDRSGRVTRIDDQRWGTTDLAYDASDRLLSHVSPTTREAFEYDGAGYMEKALQQLSSGSAKKDRWKLGPGNRLLATREHEYEYDERGRRTHKRSTDDEGGCIEYRWNASNQLTSVTTADGREVSYHYDALGRRIRKDVVDADGEAVSSTQLLWDGDCIAADIIDGKQRNFVYHPLSGVPLLQSEGGEVFTCVCDQVGVVKELIDASGKVAWSGKHSAWGKLLDSQADEGSHSQRDRVVDTPLRLRGQYYDAEAEIAYTRYRYFDADTCRWLSPDPIGLRGGQNLNSFNRSPTYVVDPLGLADGSPHPTPAEQAAAWQGSADYPGVDEWTNTTIPEGTELVMGEPGPAGFMTTRAAVEGVGADQNAVFDGLQVKPHREHGHRPQMGTYVFTEDTPAATANTTANPQHGSGGLPQYYVPGWEDSTTRTGQIDLVP